MTRRTKQHQPGTSTESSTADLPKGWTETTLDHLLVSLESGSRPRGGVRGIADGIPSVGAEHLNADGGFRFENIKFVPQTFFRRMARGIIRQGDVLVVKDGATTGKVALVRSDFPYSDAAVNEHVFVCRPSKGLKSAFLFLYLFSKEGQERILENFRGSAQGGINQNFAPGTVVPLAPLAEQKRIVAKVEELLSRVNAARERLSEVPAIFKRFRQSVLAAACSGRLTEEWRKANPDVESGLWLLNRIHDVRLSSAVSSKEKNQIAEAFRPEMLDVAEGELAIPAIPEWALCRIGAIGKVVNGSTPSRKNEAFWGKDIPWVSSGEVRNNLITGTHEKISQAGYENCSVQLLPIGTVLIAMIGEGKTRGQSAILKIDATINQNSAAILLTHGLVVSEYLWRWLQFQYEMTRAQGSGSGPQALNCQRVRELPFLLPPLAEQHEIVRLVEELLKLTDKIEKQVAQGNVQAENLTQAILAKAFRGELAPQNPDDEPASKLLERIRSERTVIL